MTAFPEDTDTDMSFHNKSMYMYACFKFSSALKYFKFLNTHSLTAYVYLSHIAYLYYIIIDTTSRQKDNSSSGYCYYYYLLL